MRLPKINFRFSWDSFIIGLHVASQDKRIYLFPCPFFELAVDFSPCKTDWLRSPAVVEHTCGCVTCLSWVKEARYQRVFNQWIFAKFCLDAKNLYEDGSMAGDAGLLRHISWLSPAATTWRGRIKN